MTKPTMKSDLSEILLEWFKNSPWNRRYNFRQSRIEEKRMGEYPISEIAIESKDGIAAGICHPVITIYKDFVTFWDTYSSLGDNKHVVVYASDPGFFNLLQKKLEHPLICHLS